MQSIAKLNQPKYGDEIVTTKGLYRIHNDWVSDDDDSKSNGLEKFTKSAGWVVSYDDIEAIIKNESGTDGSLYSYDPFGSPAVGDLIQIPLNYDNQPIIHLHTYNGKLYEMYCSGGLHIREIILSADSLTFAESGFTEIPLPISGGGDVFNFKRGSPRIVFLSRGGANTYFNVLDLSNGIPSSTEQVFIGTQANTFDTADYVHAGINRVDEDNYIFAGSRSSEGNNYTDVRMGLAKVTNGVPAILVPVITLPYNSAYNRISGFHSISDTEGFIALQYNQNNPNSLGFYKLTFDLDTGVISVTRTSLGNKWIGQEFYPLPDRKVLWLSQMNGYIVKKIFPLDDPTDDYGAAQILPSNTADTFVILPKSEDGYIMLITDYGNQAVKIKIPETGDGVAFWPPITMKNELAYTRRTYNREFPELPDGRLCAWSYENSKYQLRILDM